MKPISQCSSVVAKLKLALPQCIVPKWKIDPSKWDGFGIDVALAQFKLYNLFLLFFSFFGGFTRKRSLRFSVLNWRQSAALGNKLGTNHCVLVRHVCHRFRKWFRFIWRLNCERYCLTWPHKFNLLFRSMARFTRRKLREINTKSINSGENRNSRIKRVWCVNYNIVVCRPLFGAWANRFPIIDSNVLINSRFCQDVFAYRSTMARTALALLCNAM